MAEGTRQETPRKKIAKHSVRDLMYEAVKELIVNNQYKPDSVLQIDRLAEEFGVSATPVREALVRLEADGLVTLIHNKGAQVTCIREEDIRNIWEMRRLLEPYAARMSAGLIEAGEIDRMEREIRQMRDEPFDHDRYVASDNRLHELFYAHLANNLLKESIRRVHQMSMRIRYFAESMDGPQDRVIQEVIREHLDILGLLRKGDADRIAEMVHTHLLKGEQRTLSALSANHSA